MYISNKSYTFARLKPIILRERDIEQVSNGQAFSEEVRKEIVKNYGEEQLLEGGNVIITTLNPKLQALADKYFKMGIESYDRKHGFRGAIDNIYTDNSFKDNWGELINNYELKDKIRDEWQKAVVLNIDEKKERIIIGLKQIEQDEEITENVEDNEFIQVSNDDKLLITGYIPLKNLKWAKEYINVNEYFYKGGTGVMGNGLYVRKFDKNYVLYFKRGYGGDVIFEASPGVEEVVILRVDVKGDQADVERVETINRESKDFLSVDGIGYETNKALAEFDYSKADKLAQILNIVNCEKKETPKTGLKVAITGKLSGITRKELIDLIESKGGKVMSSVSKNTDYLIADQPENSSKYQNAQKFNIKILPAKVFIETVIN